MIKFLIVAVNIPIVAFVLGYIVGIITSWN
jgi:hypothetical protein